MLDQLWYDPVSARAHKLSGAGCLRLSCEQFFPLLKLFRNDEEKIAQAALKSFEVVQKTSDGGR